jgi:uncharacterized protein (TIGR03083 family)
MRPVEPILVADLFPGLHETFVALLRGLSEEDWAKPTACAGWAVRDVAAHLLDGDLRKLTFGRDNQPIGHADQPIESYQDLVAFLNGLNADWVRVARRIGPRVLVDLIAVTGPQVAEYVRGLDPFARAHISVAWAGEEVSLVWFDVAREYTERWHHQQQIRDAVGAAPLYAREWLHPLLDTFIRALPHAYREVEAADGSAVVVEVTGEGGDTWTVLREDGAWRLYAGAPETWATRVQLDQDAAWRMFCKQLPRNEALRRSTIEGDERLADPLFAALAVMA